MNLKLLRDIAMNGNGTASPYAPVLCSELKDLLDVYEATLAWRAYSIPCREDAYDRDETFAEVVERVTRRDS